MKLAGRALESFVGGSRWKGRWRGLRPSPYLIHLVCSWQSSTFVAEKRGIGLTSWLRTAVELNGEIPHPELPKASYQNFGIASAVIAVPNFRNPIALIIPQSSSWYDSVVKTRRKSTIPRLPGGDEFSVVGKSFLPD